MATGCRSAHCAPWAASAAMPTHRMAHPPCGTPHRVGKCFRQAHRRWRCAGACAARQGGAVRLGRCRRALFHVWPFIRRSAANPVGPTRSASAAASSPACKRVHARQCAARAANHSCHIAWSSLSVAMCAAACFRIQRRQRSLPGGSGYSRRPSARSSARLCATASGACGVACHVACSAVWYHVACRTVHRRAARCFRRMPCGMPATRARASARLPGFRLKDAHAELQCTSHRVATACCAPHAVDFAEASSMRGSTMAMRSSNIYEQTESATMRHNMGV